jgi:hypothetical protein
MHQLLDTKTTNEQLHAEELFEHKLQQQSPRDTTK